MSGNTQYEREFLRHLKNIERHAEDTAKAICEIGRMLKEYLDKDADLDKLKENVEFLIDLRKKTELLDSSESIQIVGGDGRVKLYVADDQGKMKVHEWMHNLGAHFELLDPDGEFATIQMDREEFWQYMEHLVDLGVARRVPPEPVKDTNQLVRQYLIEFSENPRVVVNTMGDKHSGRIGQVSQINGDATIEIRFETGPGPSMASFPREQLTVMGPSFCDLEKPKED